MNALNDTTALHTRYLADTHQVENVSCELADYHMYAQDTALREAVQREGAAWADADGQTPAELAVAVPRYLNDRAASIYAGSNEIQRDLIARLLLG